MQIKIQPQPPTKKSKQIAETAWLQGIRKREGGLVLYNLFLTLFKKTMASNEEENQLLSCSSAFDALWFCYSPGNQIKKYYREGTYDNCDIHQRMFTLCMAKRWR
jgi:hypothetical protein